jgi:hypothetical protein
MLTYADVCFARFRRQISLLEARKHEAVAGERYADAESIKKVLYYRLYYRLCYWRYY